MSAPSKFSRCMVTKLTNDFREAVKIEEVDTPALKDNEVLVRNKFVGINASDINFTSGKYFSKAQPPFPCGFEGIGTVAAKGSGVQLEVNQPVAYMSYGAFGEYNVIDGKGVFPVPAVKKEFLPLLVSGLTACISLDQLGDLKEGKKVLVTAAAGGTGQFAVQLAKLAGCHVIGTCSSDDKVQFLKDLGCDRPVNYTQENLAEVLKKEYPSGVDLVYECIGGDMFDTCVESLAIKGKIIVIGAISGYQKGDLEPSKCLKELPFTLLRRSATVCGFFLPHFPEQMESSVKKLFKLLSEGKLKSQTDNGDRSDRGPFKSLESIYDAVDYLYSKKSSGKIVVELPDA